MKKLIFFLMTGITLGFLSGCNLFDLDDNENSREDEWVGLGLIQKDTVADSFTIELDNGAILIPANASNWQDDVRDNQRVLANFTIMGEKESTIDSTKQYDVRINYLRNILYKNILEITPAIEDSIGNDPIHVKDHWLRNNMLNFELEYLGGNEVHYINLVKQPGTVTEPIILELRHNKNDDRDRISMSAVVTFDLSSLKVAGKDSVSFKVRAKDFNDVTFEYSGVYKY